jgi:hypothetical protein
MDGVDSQETREPTSGLEPLTCSLRVCFHMFVGVPHCSKNRLLKPPLPIPRFPMFAFVRPCYCHGYCQLDQVATRAIRASGALYISVSMDTYTYDLPPKRAEVAKKIEEILF